MELKDVKKKVVRQLKAEDFERAEPALKYAVESEVMSTEEFTKVKKTLELAKGSTSDSCINQILGLLMLLNVPEAKALHFALGKHVEKLELSSVNDIIKKALKKAGISSLEEFEKIIGEVGDSLLKEYSKDDQENNETLQGVEA